MLSRCTVSRSSTVAAAAASSSFCRGAAVASSFASAASSNCSVSSSSSAAAASFCSFVVPAQFTSRRFCATEGGAKKEGEGAKKDWPDAEAMEAEIKKLTEALKKKTEEADEFKKAALYAQADASNARRIAAEDVKKANVYGITSFAKDMLDVNDTMERAIDAFGKLEPSEVKFLTEHKLFSQLITGVKLSHNQLVHTLGRHGIENIEAKPGDEFNPNRHDAVFNAPPADGLKPGQIAVVLKKGYTIKERVLRAAQVGVVPQP